MEPISSDLLSVYLEKQLKVVDELNLVKLKLYQLYQEFSHQHTDEN